MNLKDFEFRDNDFFNSKDEFEFYVPVWKHYLKSKCHQLKGVWYTNMQPQYKCTSILAKKVKMPA